MVEERKIPIIRDKVTVYSIFNLKNTKLNLDIYKI